MSHKEIEWEMFHPLLSYSEHSEPALPRLSFEYLHDEMILSHKTPDSSLVLTLSCSEIRWSALKIASFESIDLLLINSQSEARFPMG